MAYSKLEQTQTALSPNTLAFNQLVSQMTFCPPRPRRLLERYHKSKASFVPIKDSGLLKLSSEDKAIEKIIFGLLYLAWVPEGNKPLRDNNPTPLSVLIKSPGLGHEELMDRAREKVVVENTREKFQSHSTFIPRLTQNDHTHRSNSSDPTHPVPNAWDLVNQEAIHPHYIHPVSCIHPKRQPLPVFKHYFDT